MKFNEYKLKIKFEPFYKTEQSEIFLTEKGTLCKHHFIEADKNNELFFYNFFNKKGLIKTPKIYHSGEDFIEMELIKKKKDFNLMETIKEISNLYKKTWDTKLSATKIDLSKEKLFYRLNYLNEEIKKREINPKILKDSNKFVNEKYIFPDKECIIHGDLKSIHVIPTETEIKFIDFALSGIANPWYDLSFLCMEEQEDKNKIFNNIKEMSHFYLGDELGLNKKEISNYLQSSMFYRTLYNLGFALRHRPKKSLDRIVNELNNIMNITI